MQSTIKTYAKKLLNKVQKFENQHGQIEQAVVKHFFVGQHKMILEDNVFFDPALDELKKYEDWLNE